jgi:RimJ/RimL family protein N-acetyltransferase
VKPEFRGQGISYDLLEAVISKLPQNVEIVQLCVVEGNEAATSTYEKAGFKQWGLEEKAVCVDGRFYDEKHMVKFLNR